MTLRRGWKPVSYTHLDVYKRQVLILGPNGAGKESVAQRIHYIGERKDMPFVAVNCGVIPKELAPPLFFGHIKGTCTGADANKDGYFEVAKGGTLFLDEIGILSLDVQALSLIHI